MKVRVIKYVNALLTLLLSALGFTSCESPSGAYGCPHATMDVSGTISDEEAKPVKNIHVSIKHRNHPAMPYAYSDEEGKYRVFCDGVMPFDSVDIVATDTADVYFSDSVRVKVEYDKSKVANGDNWDNGKATIKQDFHLKKK